MSVKTKDGIDAKASKPKAKKVKAKKVDYRITVEDFGKMESDSITRYMSRLAHRVGSAGMVDFGCLTYPINDKRALMIANQDLGESITSPDGAVTVSVHLAGLSCTRHGLVYRYCISVENKATGTEEKTYDIDVDNFRSGYWRRRNVPSIGAVVSEIASSEWAYIRDRFTTELYRAGLAPSISPRYEDEG